MRWQSLLKWAKSDYLKLVPILGLAFYLAFLPHQGYPYPVNVDEWTHLACSNEIIKEGTAFGLSNPFQGGAPIGNQLLEDGFHTFLAVFHLTTNIGWLTIFKYFPGIIFIITVWRSIFSGAKQGFGWQAAFFTCLIPTTVGVLGPGFLVPVALGLLFIVISVYIAFNFKSWWSYIILALLNLFLLALHSATAVALILILIPYIIINLKGNFKHSMGIALALSIPFFMSLLMFPAIKGLVQAAAGVGQYDAIRLAGQKGMPQRLARPHRRSSVPSMGWSTVLSIVRANSCSAATIVSGLRMRGTKRLTAPISSVAFVTGTDRLRAQTLPSDCPRCRVRTASLRKGDFFSAPTVQQAGQAEVALDAARLGVEPVFLVALQREFLLDGPGLRPHRRIRDRHDVGERLRPGPRPALDQMQVLARALIIGLRR